jgi:hypothetical protein
MPPRNDQKNPALQAIQLIIIILPFVMFFGGLEYAGRLFGRIFTTSSSLIWVVSLCLAMIIIAGIWYFRSIRKTVKGMTRIPVISSSCTKRLVRADKFSDRTDEWVFDFRIVYEVDGEQFTLEESFSKKLKISHVLYDSGNPAHAEVDKVEVLYAPLFVLGFFALFIASLLLVLWCVNRGWMSMG